MYIQRRRSITPFPFPPSASSSLLRRFPIYPSAVPSLLRPFPVALKSRPSPISRPLFPILQLVAFHPLAQFIVGVALHRLCIAWFLKELKQAMGTRGLISDKWSMRVLWICAIGSAVSLYMVAAERKLQNRERMIAEGLKAMESGGTRDQAA